MIAPARNCVVALCFLFCHLRALNSFPAAPATLPSRVTVNYNMNCTLSANLRIQTTASPLANRNHFASRPKRLRQRSTWDDRIPTPTQPVEFSVMLHSNGTTARRHVELYIHPRVEASAFQPSIEPAPIALEVARFGQCEDYNQFLMEPVCNKLSTLSSEEQSKLHSYTSQCADQPTLQQNPRNLVHSIFALHNKRLDRYLCVTKNGTAYASPTLKAECFVFIRQLTDSAAESREARPTCYIESKHMRRSGIVQQVRASDYYLIMSAIYPKLISDSNAECRIEKKGVVKFGGADRWVLGVSHSNVHVVHQKRISLNTLWNFDVVTPGPDRRIPLVQRPTTRPTTTLRPTATPTTTASAQTRGSDRKLSESNRRQESSNRAAFDVHDSLGDFQQLMRSFSGSQAFLDQLLLVNGTQFAADEKIKPGIADAVNNRQRNTRHRSENKS